MSNGRRLGTGLKGEGARATRRTWKVALAVLTALAVATILGLTRLAPVARAAEGASWSVFATGLQNPRGLRFGPDGNLYVAEGGLGGTMSTTPADCTQVLAPVGPYTGGFTARISRIDPAGIRTDVVTGLPSSTTSPNLGSLTSGVADVDFIGGTMYALLADAGCSRGLLGTHNGTIRVSGGSWQMIANLSAWQMAHPVKNPEPDDFEPDGTWYSMRAVRGSLYAVEPNHGEVVRVTPDGAITRVVDVSAWEGHIVPTAIAYHGNFFFGNLSTFPIEPGASKIFKLTPSGNLLKWADGLNTVLGVAFGPDGKLYVSEWGFGPPLGRILQVTVPED